MSLLDTASLIVTPNGYKEGKLYSVIPSDGSGDMSVTRATTATRVNSAGLVELVPYNLLTWSEAFDNSDWTKANINITANNIVAPNGTLTADEGAETGVNSSHEISSNVVTFSASTKYTATVHAKWDASTTRNIHIRFGNCASANVGASFDKNGNFVNYTGGGNGTLDSYIATNLGNGWWKFVVTITTANVSSSGQGIWIYYLDGTNPVYMGSTSQKIYFWGAQLNEGTLKDYQKTETRLNIPRLDYSNGTCPSLLVEPQRTNLALYSSSFDSVFWDKSSGTITTNATTAPDGNTTAELFTANGTFNNHDFFQGFTGGSSTTSTIYVKKNTAQYAYISLNYQSSGSDWATGIYDLDNLTTATFQSGGVTNQVATISDEGNGWRRITLSVSTANTALFCMYGVADSMSPSLSARGRVENSSSASFYAWGAQLEAGSYATSYIPTTSASVTRNADVISKTGISSLIGQTEGTMFWYVKKNLGENDTRLNISDGTTNNWLFVGIEFDNRPRIYCNVGGVNQFNIYGTQVSNDFHKIAFAYKANDFALYIDGVQALTHSSGSVPTCSRLDLAIAVPTLAAFTTALTNAAALWKTRLTNTQLAALTTI